MFSWDRNLVHLQAMMMLFNQKLRELCFLLFVICRLLLSSIVC